MQGYDDVQNLEVDGLELDHSGGQPGLFRAAEPDAVRLLRITAVGAADTDGVHFPARAVEYDAEGGAVADLFDCYAVNLDGRPFQLGALVLGKPWNEFGGLPVFTCDRNLKSYLAVPLSGNVVNYPVPANADVLYLVSPADVVRVFTLAPGSPGQVVTFHNLLPLSCRLEHNSAGAGAPLLQPNEEELPLGRMESATYQYVELGGGRAWCCIGWAHCCPAPPSPGSGSEPCLVGYVSVALGNFEPQDDDGWGALWTWFTGGVDPRATYVLQVGYRATPASAPVGVEAEFYLANGSGTELPMTLRAQGQGGGDGAVRGAYWDFKPPDWAGLAGPWQVRLRFSSAGADQVSGVAWNLLRIADSCCPLVFDAGVAASGDAGTDPDAGSLTTSDSVISLAMCVTGVAAPAPAGDWQNGWGHYDGTFDLEGVNLNTAVSLPTPPPVAGDVKITGMQDLDWVLLAGAWKCGDPDGDGSGGSAGGGGGGDIAITFLDEAVYSGGGTSWGIAGLTAPEAGRLVVVIAHRALVRPTSGVTWGATGLFADAVGEGDASDGVRMYGWTLWSQPVAAGTHDLTITDPLWGPGDHFVARAYLLTALPLNAVDKFANTGSSGSMPTSPPAAPANAAEAALGICVTEGPAGDADGAWDPPYLEDGHGGDGALKLCVSTHITASVLAITAAKNGITPRSWQCGQGFYQ